LCLNLLLAACIAGVPTQIAKHPDGDVLDMAAIIKDVLNDNDHVVVTPSLTGKPHSP
jgi:hypothetical protein